MLYKSGQAFTDIKLCYINDLKMQSKTLIFLAIFALGASAEKARYDNYQVFRVIPATVPHLQSLQDLKVSNEFNFWKDITMVNRAVDIMVPPHKRPAFQDFLKVTGMTATLQIKNVQELLEEEARSLPGESKALGWTQYFPLADIYAWLDQVVANNTNVKLVIGGTTYEGREIRGIEITNGADLPGVILESGIHAREWIGPASTTWIVDKIVNSANNSIWRQYNFIYFPSVNPDGYAYTFETDRMWRKTRKPYTASCYGADPNRNYNYHWLDGGSSTNPCAEDFAGSSAFSEIETKTLSDFLTSVSPRYDIHLAFHSYSQLLMFPWGYTGTHTPMHNTWQRIGDLAAAALTKVHGTQFEVGSIYETIYQTSGTSTEWYYGAFNATLAYTFELRDTGRYGFVLPPEQIIPVAEELIAAVQVFLEEYPKL